MGSRESKDIRKQVRNVTQEILPAVLNAELVAEVSKQLAEKQSAYEAERKTALTARLDTIENECRASLKRADERSRAIQGFLIQSAQQNINSTLHNVHVTMLAWQEVMAEKLGSTDELNAQIDERKVIIAARLEKEAEAEMAERIKSEEAPKVGDQTEPTEPPAAPAEEAQPAAESKPE